MLSLENSGITDPVNSSNVLHRVIQDFKFLNIFPHKSRHFYAQNMYILLKHFILKLICVKNLWLRVSCINAVIIFSCHSFILIFFQDFPRFLRCFVFFRNSSVCRIFHFVFICGFSLSLLLFGQSPAYLKARSVKLGEFFPKFLIVKNSDNVKNRVCMFLLWKQENFCVG